MKSYIYIIAALLFWVSCSDHVDSLSPNRYTKINIFTTPSELMFSQDVDAYDLSESDESLNSRSKATGLNLSVNYCFTDEDTVGIFPENDYQIPFKLPIPAGTVATTSVILAEGWATKKDVLYAVYLPWKFENRYYNKVPWDYRKVQIQDGNDTKDSLSNYWFLASDTLTSSNSSFGARLIHMGAIIRCQVTVPVAATFVRLILASSANSFATHGYYDLFDTTAPKEDVSVSGVIQKITSNPYLHQPFIAEGYTDHVTMDLKNVTMASGGKLRAWFVLPETDVAGQTLSVYLYDSAGNCYTASKLFTTGNYSRNTVTGIGFSGLVLTSTPFTNLNPWEEEDLCPTCNPVAF